MIGGETESANVKHHDLEEKSSCSAEDSEPNKGFMDGLAPTVCNEGKLSKGKFDRRMSHHE